MENGLDVLVDHMRNMGEQLIPYNFPHADARLEDDLGILKTKEVYIDGYSVLIHYSKADCKTHRVETLQVFGKRNSFIPFRLAVKLAKKFLGSHNLILSEIFRENRKIYCWSIVVDLRGRPISAQHKDAQVLFHEGIEYSYVDPKYLNFY